MFFYTLQYIIFIIVSGSETGQHDPYRPKKYEWCLRIYFRHIKKACSKPNFYPLMF